MAKNNRRNNDHTPAVTTPVVDPTPTALPPAEANRVTSMMDAVDHMLSAERAAAPAETVESVLGSGGEVTTPVTAQTVPGPSNNGSFNLSGAIRMALENLGVDASRSDVLEHIRITHGKTESDINIGSFNNSLSVVRNKVRNGDTPARSSGGKTVELTDAVRLCQALRMTPAALVAHLDTITTVGSVDAIRAALAQIIAVAELMNAQSK
ncbi:unnamed protein product [Sphagnum balticum]